MRRAALLHDLGRVGVSERDLGQARPARRRPSGSACACTRTTPSARWRGRAGLAPLGALAGAHHERLDGSGYHRGCDADVAADARARVLAAADVYHALTEPRPHRRRLQPRERGRGRCARRCAAGGSMRDAAEAVLDAAGQRARAGGAAAWPAGLTEREVEVLRALARGHVQQGRSRASSALSPKTVGHHVAARLHEDRRLHPRRGDAVRDRARPAARLRTGAPPHCPGVRCHADAPGGLLLALLLAAALPTVARADAPTRFSLAGGCYDLRAPSGSVVANGSQLRLQATRLGSYLLYTPGRQFLAAGDAGNVGPVAQPSPQADWQVDDAGGGGSR